MNVELTVDPEIDLPTRMNLIMYRLVQELLNNALKYGEASEIRASLEQQATQRVVRYVDDGKGFDFEQAYRQRSLGLKLLKPAPGCPAVRLLSTHNPARGSA